MESKRWISMLIFTYFNVVKETAALLLCPYRTATGITQHTYCSEICCEGPDIRFDNVCCRAVHEWYVYIGISMTGFILVASIVYACCKQKCSEQRSSSGSSSRTNDQLPTVSFSVQPPPPYTNPPPYHPEEPGTSVKVEEWFTLPKEPPPPYSLHDTTS